LNFLQKNIRYILISFSIVAFIVFYLLALKLFNNNKVFYVVVDSATALNKGDFIYTDDEKIGSVNELDTSKSLSNKVIAKIILNRNLNIPDKSYFQIEQGEAGNAMRLALTLKASSGYYEKNDTIPLLLPVSNAITVREPQKKVEKTEINQPVTIDSIKPPIETKKEESRIAFKVQFVTSVDKIPQDSKIFKGIQNVSFYKDKTLYKYVTGSTSDLSESVKYCEEIKKLGFPDAFVVAFSGDQRIPVKEAVKLLKK